MILSSVVKEIELNFKKTIASMLVVCAFVLMFSCCMCASAKTLEDGVYEVNIYLWHSSKDKASMAKNAIKTKAKIDVTNSVGTMYLYAQPTKIMGMSAHLYELRIKSSSGSFYNASITQRDSNGDPYEFKFTLPHNSKFIDVKVNPHVAMMGNKDISARIKVDYSSLRLIKSKPKPTKPSNNNSGSNKNTDTKTNTNNNGDTNKDTVTNSPSNNDIANNDSNNKSISNDNDENTKSANDNEEQVVGKDSKKNKNNTQQKSSIENVNIEGEKEGLNNKSRGLINEENKGPVTTIIVSSVLLVLTIGYTVVYFIKVR